MANEKTSMALSSQTPEKIPVTSRVLLVDADSTRLKATSTMLENLGYTVTTATEGYQALTIVLHKENELDFILADSNIAGIDKYEFLALAVQVSSLPVLLMSADNSEKEIMGCLYKGSSFYILKPLDEKKAKALWQFSVLKTSVAEEQPMQGYGQVEQQTVIDTNDQNTESDNRATKKQKIWDPAFMDRLLEAVRTFGIDDAQPQKILSEVDGFRQLKRHAARQLKRTLTVPPIDQPCRMMRPDEMEINGPAAFGNSHQQPPPPPPEQENGDEDLDL